MSDFISFAESNGVLIRYLDDSGDIKRVGTTDKPSSKNGAYSWDGKFGWVSNWSNGGEPVYYKSDYVNYLSEEDKKRIAQKRADDETTRLILASLVKEDTARILKTCERYNHPYLKSKGLDNLALVERNDIIVPMYYYADYSLVGYQRIALVLTDYLKRMAKGMQAKGAIHILGNRASPEYLLCEGYATGLSLHNAISSCGLDMAVVVCFSARNMTYIAQKLKSRPGFIYADNDESKTGEEAAKLSELKYCMSEKVGNDANDDMKEFGLQYVINKIVNLRKS